MRNNIVTGYVDDLFGDHETGSKNHRILIQIHNFGSSLGVCGGICETIDRAKLNGEPIGVTFERLINLRVHQIGY